MTAEPKAKKGTTMAEKQELSVREKKELVAKEEKTIPGRYYVPYADIHETDDALAVVMEMPGVEKKDLNIALENDVLRVDGQIDFSKYKDMEPVYTEYNIGHYARSFTLSNKVDQDKISANLEDGVLTLTLPKAKAAQPRNMDIAKGEYGSPAAFENLLRSTHSDVSHPGGMPNLSLSGEQIRAISAYIGSLREAH